MARAATSARRKLQGGRTTSMLPALIDLVFDRPLVSSEMIAAALGVTPRAARDLVAALALPETTGAAAMALLNPASGDAAASLGTRPGIPAASL